MPFYPKSILIQKLNDLGIYLDKHRGQCYLIDENIAKFIGKSINLNLHQDIILEIGAGLGTLSDILIEQSKQAYLIENDKKIVNHLKREYESRFSTIILENPTIENYEMINDTNKVIIIQGDILTIPFPKVTKVIGNIPYQISAPILFKLIENWAWDSAFLMVQKEFADRLTAPLNSKNYSRLTAATSLYLKIKKLRQVPPSCFFPEPKVLSTIIEIDSKLPENSNSLEDPRQLYRKEFLEFLKGIFPYKNKNLGNAIEHYINAQTELTRFHQNIIQLKNNSSLTHLMITKVRNIPVEQLFEIVKNIMEGIPHEKII